MTVPVPLPFQVLCRNFFLYFEIFIAYSFVIQNKYVEEYRKKHSYVKYSSKRRGFIRFFSYLCHVVDDFACLKMRH